MVPRTGIPDEDAQKTKRLYVNYNVIEPVCLLSTHSVTLLSDDPNPFQISSLSPSSSPTVLRGDRLPSTVIEVTKQNGCSLDKHSFFKDDKESKGKRKRVQFCSLCWLLSCGTRLWRVKWVTFGVLPLGRQIDGAP